MRHYSYHIIWLFVQHFSLLDPGFIWSLSVLIEGKFLYLLIWPNRLLLRHNESLVYLMMHPMCYIFNEKWWRKLWGLSSLEPFICLKLKGPIIQPKSAPQIISVSITERLTSCLFCLDLVALLMRIKSNLLVWSNPNQSNRTSPIHWYFPCTNGRYRKEGGLIFPKWGIFSAQSWNSFF